MYLRESAVKKKIRDMGYCCGNGLMQSIDTVIESMLRGCTDYVRPAKTMRREDFLAYAMRKNIKL